MTFIYAWWLLPAAFLLTGCGVIMITWMWNKGIIREVFSRKGDPKTKAKAEKELKDLAEDLKPVVWDAPLVAPPDITSLKKEPEPAPAPALPITPVAPPPLSPNLKMLEELAIKEGVQIKIVRQSPFGSAVIHRKKLKLGPRSTDKDIFCFDYRDNMYYFDIWMLQKVKVKGKEVLELIYNVLYSEPLNSIGLPIWDQGFEDIITDDAMDQYLIACTFEGKFEFTRNVQILMAVVFILMLPVGIVINAGTNLIPTVHITWVPFG